MKAIALLLVLALSGCTTLKPGQTVGIAVGAAVAAALVVGAQDDDGDDGPHCVYQRTIGGGTVCNPAGIN